MTFFNTIFVAAIVLSLFWNVSKVDLKDDNEDLILTRRAIFNWIGLALLLTNNIMFPSIQNVVLQMPEQVPVFKREIMNHMYSPSVYYFARTISGILV